MILAKEKNKRRFTTIEMKFVIITAGYTLLGHKGNEEILEKIKAEPAEGKLRGYKPNCLRHVTGMYSSRMAKRVLNCRPNRQGRL